MSGRRYDPIKVGSRKTLLFAFIDDDGDVISMVSGTITIVDDDTGDKLVDNAAATIVSGELEYEWLAPPITGKSRDCIVEWKGIESVGAEPRKSGADGLGDYKITILKSHTS